MMRRTRACDPAMAAGRLRKAEQFWEAAETIREFASDEGDVGDAYVTLCVHAAIAASDAICCSALAEHAIGDNHAEAVTLLSRVRPNGKQLGTALRTLLTMKTRAGYSHQPVTRPERTRAQRHAARLVRAARERVIDR